MSGTAGPAATACALALGAAPGLAGGVDFLGYYPASVNFAVVILAP